VHLIKKIIHKNSISPFLSSCLGLKSALGIGIILACLFASVTSIRLTAQGLYYDELHQAASSFSYTGDFHYKEVKPYMFARTRIHGIPVLNMSYSGAIKSGIYGLYLRYFNSHFSIYTWRILGIIFVTFGIFLFFVIVSRKLSFISLGLFYFMLLTDVTVVLTTRHDWGPVALAMLIRILFVVTWFYGETKKTIPLSNSFLLGLLVGAAIFEKLSSIVLVLPLILVFAFSPGRRTPRHSLACIAGGFLGVAPLIIVNLNTLVKYRFLISFESLASNRKSPYSFPALMIYIVEYLSLGAGKAVKKFILGIDPSSSDYFESALVGLILLIITIAHFRHSKHNSFFRLSGIMLMCYIAVGVSLYLLPKRTAVHHWIIGTPFQYTAIMLAFQGSFLNNSRVQSHRRFLRLLLLFFISILLLTRFVGIIPITKAFSRGQASLNWDSSLSKIGYFAASRADEAIFIAADWGLATQIFCLSNGNPRLVYELFWDYEGPGQIRKLLKESSKKTLYAISMNRRTGEQPEVTDYILNDIEKMTDLKEVPIEKDLLELRAVKVRKYSYVAEDLI
jgi:hypothetical protein